MASKVKYNDLGIIDYKRAWDIQEEFFSNIMKHKVESLRGNLIQPSNYQLFFCEHPHVYTLGKSGDEQNLLIDSIQLQAKNASFYKINRGGDITYHGPGQIVGYPIIDLEKFGLGIRGYIELLEEAVIETLKYYGISGERLDGATGVWLDTSIKGKSRKICAIGVRASRYITMHGFAFNVNTDLKYFGYINPCGFVDKGVTTLSQELGRTVDIDEVKGILLKNMTKLFGWELLK